MVGVSGEKGAVVRSVVGFSSGPVVAYTLSLAMGRKGACTSRTVSAVEMTRGERWVSSAPSLIRSAESMTVLASEGRGVGEAEATP